MRQGIGPDSGDSGMTALTERPNSVGEAVAQRYYQQGYEAGMQQAVALFTEGLYQVLSEWQEHRAARCYCQYCEVLLAVSRELSVG